MSSTVPRHPKQMQQSLIKSIQALKSKNLGFVDLVKSIQTLKRENLDKWTMMEIYNFSNNGIEGIARIASTKKFQVLHALVEAALENNGVVDHLEFKPVYNPKRSSKKKDLPCMKDGYEYVKASESGSFGEGHVIKKKGKQYFIKKIAILRKYSIGGETTYTEDHLKDIKNEIKILKKAGRLGVSPKLHDYYLCEDGGGPAVYLIMDYIEGETLWQFLHYNPLTTTLKRKVAKAIKTLEDEIGLWHYNFGLSNIMIAKGRVYIIDFGLARILDDDLRVKEQTQRIYREHTGTILTYSTNILTALLIKEKVV